MQFVRARAVTGKQNHIFVFICTHRIVSIPYVPGGRVSVYIYIYMYVRLRRSALRWLANWKWINWNIKKKKNPSLFNESVIHARDYWVSFINLSTDILNFDLVCYLIWFIINLWTVMFFFLFSLCLNWYKTNNLNIVYQANDKLIITRSHEPYVITNKQS